MKSFRVECSWHRKLFLGRIFGLQFDFFEILCKSCLPSLLKNRFLKTSKRLLCKIWLYRFSGNCVSRSIRGTQNVWIKKLPIHSKTTEFAQNWDRVEIHNTQYPLSQISVWPSLIASSNWFALWSCLSFSYEWIAPNANHSQRLKSPHCLLPIWIKINSNWSCLSQYPGTHIANLNPPLVSRVNRGVWKITHCKILKVKVLDIITDP